MSDDIGGADPGTGQQQQQQQPGGQPPPDPGTAPPAPHPAYRPDGLPDNFYGKSDKETIDRMWPALKGFMKVNSERGSVPDKPDSYAMVLSDKAKPYVQIDAEDKLVPKVKEIAKKWGMPDKMFSGFVGDFFDQVVDLNLIEKPVDPKQIYINLGKSEGGSEEHQIQKGTARLNQAQHFITNLGQQQGFDQSMKDELALLTTSEPGVRIIEALMKGTVTRSISPGGGGAGEVTKEDLAKRRADPRNNRDGDKYDPAFAAETIELYKKLYGE